MLQLLVTPPVKARTHTRVQAQPRSTLVKASLSQAGRGLLETVRRKNAILAFLFLFIYLFIYLFYYYYLNLACYSNLLYNIKKKLENENRLYCFGETRVDPDFLTRF